MVEKDQWPCWRSLHYWVVSQDCFPRNSILTAPGKLGSNRTVKFSNDTWHHLKDREGKGPSQERNPCEPKFEDRTLQETLQQERCARREAWDLAKNVFMLKTRDKATFHSPTEAWVMPAPSSEKARGTRISGRFRSFDAHAEQKGLHLSWTGNSSKIEETHNGDYSKWGSASKWGSTGKRSRPWALHDGGNPRWHACRPVH